MTDAGAGASAAATTSSKAGEMLRTAREARGLSLDEIAARTRIPLRHLQAIEASEHAQLPSPTYAVGFAKAFARVVGADEVAVADKIRGEVAMLGRRQPDYTPYEMADPARVPSRGLAIVALGVAVAVLVLAALWFTTMRGGTESPPVAASEAAPVATAPVPAPSAAKPTSGQVTLTATDEVWLRVYDASNKVLFQGTMKAGDHFDVPAGADRPMINVGRPDKLSVTLNGSAMPPLGTGERPIKDVRVDAASVAAKLSGSAAVPEADGAGTR